MASIELQNISQIEEKLTEVCCLGLELELFMGNNRVSSRPFSHVSSREDNLSMDIK